MCLIDDALTDRGDRSSAQKYMTIFIFSCKVCSVLVFESIWTNCCIID